jgi:hypothetical protein
MKFGTLREQFPSFAAIYFCFERDLDDSFYNYCLSVD